MNEINVIFEKKNEFVRRLPLYAICTVTRVNKTIIELKTIIQ